MFIIGETLLNSIAYDIILTQNCSTSECVSTILKTLFKELSGEQNRHHLLRFSVQFSRSVMSDSLRPHELQHTRPPCPSPTPGVHPNPCPLSQWCHPTISSSVVPFSSCLQPFPASGSFPVSQFFASGGQSIGVSASASVLPVNIQDWSPWWLTGWISLQSKGLWRVFSSTTVQKHQSLYTTFSSCLSFENWKIKPHFQVTVDT